MAKGKEALKKNKEVWKEHKFYMMDINLQ